MSVHVEELVVTSAGRPLVDVADIGLPPGRAVTIVGESGSGKSLLAHAVMGTLAPELEARGRLRLDDTGYDVAAIEDPHFGRARSRLHQLLADLSAQTRQCLELSLFEGLNLGELAARTGQKTQSVLGHLALAHDHVSEGLRTEWST